MTEKDCGQQRPDQEAAEFLREHYPGGVPDGVFQTLLDIQYQVFVKERREEGEPSERD